MKHTPGLWHIVLGLLLIVMCARPGERHPKVWDERLVPPARGRQYHNPRRNRERWARRLAKRRRQQTRVSRAGRHRKRTRVLRQILQAYPNTVLVAPPNKQRLHRQEQRRASGCRSPILWTKRTRWLTCGRHGGGLTI